MNKLVQLVNEWDAFEQTHPESDIEDFCRYYLIRQREQTQEERIAGGIVPPGINELLLKLLGRIIQIFMVYTRMAFEKGPFQMEEFAFLNSIKHLGESKKTDIINYNLCEFSTGMDTLSRLKKTGFISERPDPHDKRSKLVQITPEGEQALMDCYKRLPMIGKIMLHDMPEDDKNLCIHLLKDVEIKHSRRCLEYKNGTLEGAYRAECGSIPPFSA